MYVGRSEAQAVSPRSPQVPSNQLEEAAKGINLMDLMLRSGVMFLGAFQTLDEAEKRRDEAAAYFEVTIQVNKAYEWFVVPGFTSHGIIYEDGDMKKFMQQYSREQRMNQEAFAKRKEILAEETKKINERAARGELVCDPTLGGLLAVEKVMGFHKLDIATQEPADAAAASVGGDEPAPPTVTATTTSWRSEVEKASSGGVLSRRIRLETYVVW